MALTDTSVKQAKPKEKAYTLKDIQGLSLYIPPKGSKSWYFRFTFMGKEGRISLGTYPQISLKDARLLAENAKGIIAQGIDPREERKAKKSFRANSKDESLFANFVKTWIDFKLKVLNAKPSKEKKNKGRQSTAVQIERYMRLDILPVLGNKKLSEITRADVLAIQSNIEKRGALSIAEKVRTWLNEIFRYAVAQGYIDINPAADMDIVAIPYRRNNHNPHLTMDEMHELLNALNKYRGDRRTVLGLRLLLLTGVRTGELRFAEHNQFDLANGMWKIPAEDVKQLQEKLKKENNKIPDYIVPLSQQAITIVEELFSYRHPEQRYLLSHRSDPKETISENTLNGALKRMGFKQRLTGHGIRATISTALNELDYNKDWVEAQLSHSDKDAIRATYNHAKYIEPRRKMMQDWADLLDKLENTSSNKIE